MFENPRQALLGYLEYIEKISNPEAGIAMDKMQHAMMRPAKAEVVEQGIRLAGEIAIGEKQELDIRNQRVIRKRQRTANGLIRG